MTLLTQTQLDHYETKGYLALDSWISDEWLERLNAKLDEYIEVSRTAEPKDRRFDTEPEHSPDNPRLRRINTPTDVDPIFAEFALDGPATDLAEAILGPNIRFHHSKLNIKWHSGGDEVKWHQDIQFWPHTDFSPLTIGVYLRDVDDEMGPMGIVPGSHKGPLFDLADEEGAWTGALNDTDLAQVDLDSADYLKGPAGSVTVHNCCAVHGSEPNDSERMRPLLLQTYSRADSYPLIGVGANGATGRSGHQIVRGGAPTHIEVDGRRMPAAPDWSRGYTSIFDVQGN